MKPSLVVLLMVAAAIGGGLIVRYSDHPMEITLAHSAPPTVVAPPIPQTVHVGPSTSVPIHAAPAEPPVATQPERPAGKPSAFSETKRPAKAEPAPAEPRIVARVKMPLEPPAVTPLERSTVAPVALAAPPPKPAPAPAPPQQTTPAPPESNHATLRAGMLISVRINQALSSNLNSPGDVFSGTLDKPLIADGFAIAERGAQVRGEVVESKSAGRVSELTIRLREILASDGQRVHLVSDPWRKVSTGMDAGARPGNVYDTALTKGGAAVIRPATSITFRLGETVELSEKR